MKGVRPLVWEDFGQRRFGCLKCADELESRLCSKNNTNIRSLSNSTVSSQFCERVLTLEELQEQIIVTTPFAHFHLRRL